MTAKRYVLLAAGAVITLALASVYPASVRLVYNASDSAPTGWYVIRPAQELMLGQYVVARLPDQVAALAAKRGYLPLGVPVLKRIAALPGQHVCMLQSSVQIGSDLVAETLKTDRVGRALSPWRGCRTLLADELFLLNADHPASFDSRYFGPLDRSFVQGSAVRLSLFRKGATSR